jgi:hypothetical protein
MVYLYSHPLVRRKGLKKDGKPSVLTYDELDFKKEYNLLKDAINKQGFSFSIMK